MAKKPSQRLGASPYLVRVSGRKAWHIRDGEQRISTSETDRSAATRALFDYIEKKKIAEAASAQVTEKATLSEILDLWAAKRQQKNPGTWNKKWKYIDNKLRERAGWLQLSEINDEWLGDYERSRYLNDCVSEPTVRQEVQIIVSAWSLALAAVPPLTALPVPKLDLPAASQMHDVFLTRDESERLIEAAKQRHKEAGLDGKGITPHIMRHSAITWLMQAGEDIYKVAGFAGHKDTKMIIERYGHHHPDFQSGIARHLSQR